MLRAEALIDDFVVMTISVLRGKSHGVEKRSELIDVVSHHDL